jgi:nucleotide-binding universal stress UspA family protein
MQGHVWQGGRELPWLRAAGAGILDKRRRIQGDEEGTVYRKILVPLDGSEMAVSVLEQVTALARAYKARLLLLTVEPPLPALLPRASDIQLTLTFQAEAYLGKVRVYLEAQGVAVTTTVCVGEPACEILDMAERQAVDLIVINSRGGGGTRLPFLGSVAEKVASASSVPVLVLHAATATERT